MVKFKVKVPVKVNVKVKLKLNFMVMVLCTQKVNPSKLVKIRHAGGSGQVSLQRSR